MADKAFLIAGLGNPGSSYDKTRHNVGFEVADAFASSQRIQFKSHLRFKGELAKGDFEVG